MTGAQLMPPLNGPPLFATACKMFATDWPRMHERRLASVVQPSACASRAPARVGDRGRERGRPRQRPRALDDHASEQARALRRREVDEYARGAGDSPKSVTFDGSPPKAAAFFFTH